MKPGVTMIKTVTIGILGISLSACQTVNTAPTPSPMPSQTTLSPASVSDPGSIAFRINPSGNGAYYGWRMQVAKAARNRNFKTFTTEQLSAGQMKEYALWPDSYLVRVSRLGELESESWVDVFPGEVTVVYADYGLFSEEVKISREPDLARIDPNINTGIWRIPITTTYDPEVMFAHEGYRAEYTGPQNNGNPVGTGTVEITRNGQPFAEINNADITGEKITGDIKYADGREVDGEYLNDSRQIEPGSTTKWPDGTSFTGTYRVFDPRDGKLYMADGNVWQGPVHERKPVGQGRLTWWEGGWIELPEGSAFPKQTGEFFCGEETVPAGECYYYGGKKLSGPDELATLMERDRQIAEAAAKTAAESAAQKIATESPQPQTAAQGSCRTANGTFRDNTGNSTLALNSPGQGNGNFVSYTYGGAQKYRFEIGFTYVTTANSISVTYGNGTYSDAATGQVLQSMSAQSGISSCRFDGNLLVIDGVEYRR